MNANKLIMALFAVSFMSACAEGPVRPTSAAAVETKSKASLAYVSTRTENNIKADACPASATSWHKENLSKLLPMANACAQYKKLDRLEDLANHMAQYFVAEPWGAFYLSVAAEQRHDYPRALWMAELAIKKSPHNGLLYYQRGRIHWDLNETGLAVDDYNLALKENSRLADAHLVLAQFYTRANDLKTAEAHYSQFIVAEPENHSVLAAFAEVEISLNHSKYAIELYERAASASPRNIEYRLRLGYLYEINQKNYEQALTTYRHIKSLLTESRAPADVRAAEVNDKIKKLEALVAPEPKEDSKVTSSAQPAKVQVKK